MIFNLCGLGGTFDHIHEGHKLLISTAFKLGKEVAIALTTNKMLTKKKFRNKIQSYEVRKENILNYIKELNPEYLKKCHIIPLNNPFGPAITDPNIEVHVSSEETIKVALKINEIRETNGLKKMFLMVVPTVKNESGEKLSSTHIREDL